MTTLDLSYDEKELLDICAVHALSGLLANPSYDTQDMATMSQAAYEAAEAMILTRRLVQPE